MICADGQGYQTNHKADGWLCTLGGRRIVAQCRAHADACIEYAAKLGETWIFQSNPPAPAAGEEERNPK